METKDKWILGFSIAILAFGCSLSVLIFCYSDKEKILTSLVLIVSVFLAFLFTFLCLKIFKQPSDAKKKLNDENEVKKVVISSSNYTDFARNEIYAFKRLTAILTTFFLTASFTIWIFVKDSDLNPGLLFEISFVILISLGFINIILIWWRLKRTIFEYYSKFDRQNFKNPNIEQMIRTNAGKWQKVIWWMFLTCFIAFLFFLFSIVYFT
jgi:hypothetical protein